MRGDCRSSVPPPGKELQSVLSADHVSHDVRNSIVWLHLIPSCFIPSVSLIWRNPGSIRQPASSYISSTILAIVLASVIILSGQFLKIGEDRFGLGRMAAAGLRDLIRKGMPLSITATIGFRPSMKIVRKL